MNIQSQIVALERLSVIDEEIARLEADLEQERIGIGEKRQHLDGLDHKLDTTTGSIQDMERLRNELVAEARQTSAQMERSREKLARSRSEREVNAAQREVEELRKLFRDREIEIQKLVALLDHARSESNVIEEQRSSLSQELGEKEGDSQTKVSQLESEVAVQRELRQAIVKEVPPVLYRRYEMIRKRRGSGLCHTITGTCSACHIQLPPMLFQVLRRAEDFDQCPSCNRILYFKQEPAEGADDKAATVAEKPATDEAQSEATPDNGT